MVLLNKVTGDLNIVTVTQKADHISAPSGYKIEIVERPSGVMENGWNTQRTVLEPANTVVLLNVWPHYTTHQVPVISKNKQGKKVTTYKARQVVENVIYTPYSDELRVPEIIEAGKEHRKNDVQAAFDLLKKRGVVSKAFPGKLVADINYLKPAFFERLPLLEQTDFTEFLFDPNKTLERVDTLIGTNGKDAYAPLCNSVGACGWVQYTSTTYNSIRLKYPTAKLMPDFKAGAAEHVNSMMAAILLFDYNLVDYISEFGNNILTDSNQLEEVLDSSYNGAPVHAHKSLSASILQGLDDWITKYLKRETVDYMAKLRYIRDNYSK